jgi:hypothetical protein
MLLAAGVPAVIAAGLLGAWAAGWLGRPPAAPDTPQQPPAPSPPAPAPQPVTAQAPPAKKADEGDFILMPDGSKPKALNGVKQPPKALWGDQPWSPIVRIQHDPGLDWYVHADGSYTTSLMQWRSDLNDKTPVTICLHPAQVMPTDEPASGQANGQPRK